MRWRQHYNDTRQEERVAEMLDQASDRPSGRHEFYGMWITLLDFVAARMTPDNPAPSAQFRDKQWARYLDASQRSVAKLFKLAAKERLISVDRTGDLVRVSIPDLSKYVDDYFRKSVRGPDRNLTTRQNRTEPNRTGPNQTGEDSAGPPPGTPDAVRWPAYIHSHTRRAALGLTADADVLAEALARHKTWATDKKVPLEETHGPAQAGFLTTLRNVLGLPPEVGKRRQRGGGPAPAAEVLGRVNTGGR